MLTEDVLSAHADKLDARSANQSKRVLALDARQPIRSARRSINDKSAQTGELSLFGALIRVSLSAF